MIIAKKGVESTPIPEGTHIAICYKMVHIGHVYEEYMGEKKLQNKVQLTFELPFETKVFNQEKGAQPMVISKEYTLSMHEKSNMRKDLEAWRGKKFTETDAESFDITNLLGKGCQITVVHNKKGYATIASITGVAKGTTLPLQSNASTELSYDNFNWDLFNELPDFIKNKIVSSKEYKAMNDKEEVHAERTQDINEKQDLPF